MGKSSSLHSKNKIIDEKRVKYIPAYVVTGLQHSGKTTFINKVLSRNKRILCVQFECGNTIIDEKLNDYVKLLTFEKSDFSTDETIEETSAKLATCISMNDFEEVWIEWNSELSISVLQKIFRGNPKNKYYMLSSVCKLKKAICIYGTDCLKNASHSEKHFQERILSECDIVALHKCCDNKEFLNVKKHIKSINKDSCIIPNKDQTQIFEELQKKYTNTYSQMILNIIIIILLYFFTRQVAGAGNTDLTINIFIGIILQAFPFLLIGILLSSAIHVFVSESFIQKHFPMHPVTGGLFAAFSGFFLPVCDCASVPVFKSLIKKGVPLSSAVTFMMATPVINPVVIISTWYAFGYNIKVVLCRVLLGIICAMIIGLSFSRYDKKNSERKNNNSGSHGCCCCEKEHNSIGIKKKLLNFFLHAEAEFFEVGKYLIIGSLISAIFQTVSKSFNWSSGNSNLLISLIIMMAMAFSFSLCSSSDAIVGRSFLNQFPIGAIMGFLVFGPMIDIKNISMLLGSFSKSFVIRLCITTFIVCFIAVFICFKIGLGSIII